MIKIAYGNDRAKISPEGAQLRSLILNGRELLWQGDPNIWSDSAPVLFPFIGRCSKGSYTHEGKTYSMGLHGFAWKKIFHVIEQTELSCLLELMEDAETLENYPFSFRFQVGYNLDENQLNVFFRVVNCSKNPMPFALGWHPGFALESSPENYQIRFPETTTPEEIQIVPNCMITGEISSFPLVNHTIPLNREMFLHSARVYRGLGNTAILENLGKGEYVRMHYPGFSYTTLWQTLGSGASFICIEPWLGLPCRSDQIVELGQAFEMLLYPGEIMLRKITVTSSGR